jgi:hypothetical protein
MQLALSEQTALMTKMMAATTAPTTASATSAPSPPTGPFSTGDDDPDNSSKDSDHSDESNEDADDPDDQDDDDDSTPPTKGKSKHPSAPATPSSVPTTTQIAQQAERETKNMAANYHLVNNVTAHFPKLNGSNYDAWRRRWKLEANTLEWNSLFMSIDGPLLDVSAEMGTESNHRKNAARMVIKTIDPTEHEMWLRDTDQENPQAIFRRMHLKFRGSETTGAAARIEATLLTISMKNTKFTVTAFGTAIVENLRKLTEMGVPMNEKKMINIYLLGLHKNFDPIRWKLQRAITTKKSTAPKTMAEAKKTVEDWATTMPDRHLLDFKDNTGSDNKSDVLTLFGEVSTAAASTEACRGWTTRGKCNANTVGKCKYVHDVKKKGINAPSALEKRTTATNNRDRDKANPSSNAPSRASTKDFSTIHCDVCNVKGHSKNWAQCPAKKKATPSRSVLSVNSVRPPGGPPVPNKDSDASAMHIYNLKLMDILNNLTSNRPAGQPVLDMSALTQALGGTPPDH